MAFTTPTKKNLERDIGNGSNHVGINRSGNQEGVMHIQKLEEMRIQKLKGLLGVFNERIKTLEDLAGVKCGAGCASFYNSRIEKLEALAGVNPNAIGNAQERIKALEIWFGVE